MTTILVAIYDLAIIIVLFLYLRSLYGNRAPFIPAPKTAISRVVEEMDIRDGDTVYDLGCGNARMLVALHTANPRARFVGIEKELLPYILAKIRVAFLQSENIVIRRGDIFAADIRDADRIFTYLFPDVMGRLEPKFATDCKKGARLVSLDFFLPHRETSRFVNLGRPEGKKGRFIFSYNY